MKKTVLVTGGAGFIGSHIVDLLMKKKLNVIVIDNFSGGRKKNILQHIKKKNFTLLNKNICDKKTFEIKKLKKVNYVIHLAGKGDIVPSINSPYDYIYTNVIGTLNVLEFSRSVNINKFVYAASSSCYGLAKTPTKETNPLNPLYPYALSKLQGEELVMHWQKVYKLPAISIRIFNAYGTRVKTTGSYGAVFGVFFKQKLSNKSFTVVGDGNQKRDFLYVTDVANAFVKAVFSNKKNKVYNLGAGNPQKIKYLIKLLENKNGQISLPKRPGEPSCTWANISKIKKELKWKPKVSFEKGVKNMLANIREWTDAPLWNKKQISREIKSWNYFMKDVK